MSGNAKAAVVRFVRRTTDARATLEASKGGAEQAQRRIDSDAKRERIVALIAHEVRMRVLDNPVLLGNLLALLGLAPVDDLT